MENCPRCGNMEIISIEYAYGSQERYDGISEYLCPKPPHGQGCGYRQGRWTGKELHDGEIESRYGERGVVKSE